MLQFLVRMTDSSRMRIKSYKDLVGLSIAQARAAYDIGISDLLDEVDMDPETGKSWRWLHAEAGVKIESLTLKIEALVGVIADVTAQRDAAQAEVERLTKVIASYDTIDDLELRTARDFIKAFNIDVEKYKADTALKAMKQSLKEGMDAMPSVTADEAYTQTQAVVESPEELAAEEKPSKDSLRKVWEAIYSGRGLSAVGSKWTRRRLAQLNRLQELGYAFKGPSGAWWARESGPGPDET